MAKRALGKGLSALLGDAAHADPVPGGPTPSEPLPGATRSTLGDREAVLLDCSRVQANPHQPRKHMDERALQELADSIRENGVLQPILVRRTSQGHELIAGERRLRAARLAGLTEIPALVWSVEEAASLRIALLENIQREDLNAVEEAEAYQAIMRHYGATQREVATMLGKDRSTISNLLRLLGLEQSILDLLRENTISMGHARALLGVEDPPTRLRLSRLIQREGLSVRQLEQRVKALGRPKRAADRSLPNDRDRAAVAEFETPLQHHFGTPVHIRRRGKRGRIELEFFSDEELEGLIERLGISPRL